MLGYIQLNHHLYVYKISLYFYTVNILQESESGIDPSYNKKMGSEPSRKENPILFSLCYISLSVGSERI